MNRTLYQVNEEIKTSQAVVLKSMNEIKERLVQDEERKQQEEQEYIKCQQE